MLVRCLIAVAVLLLTGSVQAQSLETLNVSYASVTGSRIPLWIAKDTGLFEKNGAACQSRGDCSGKRGHWRPIRRRR